MSMFGKRKRAYFEDGCIFECDRTCDLRRHVRERRIFEGYRGRVWFREEPWLAVMGWSK